MTVTRLTHPNPEVLTRDELRAHCLPASSDDDALLERQAKAARARCETTTDRCYGVSRWQLVLPCFPAAVDPIAIPRPPLRSVESIAYTDTDGNAQTLSGHSDDIYSTPGKVTIDGGWPATKNGTPVVIIFVAGYDLVPEEAQQAMLLLVGHWYMNREEVTLGQTPTKVPMAAQHLLQSLKWNDYA